MTMTFLTDADEKRFVKSVNGNTPDENGNVTVEGGGSAVQSDLDQNDPTQPDYVKGRTHWVEQEDVLTDKIFLVFGQPSVGFDDPFSLEMGKDYIVNWAGEEYTVKAVDASVVDEQYTGCAALVNEAFAIVALSGEDGDTGVIFPYDGKTQFTVSIYTAEVIHPLDPKYLGDGYPHYVQGFVFPETDAVAYTHPKFGPMWVALGVPTLEIGKTYTIIYNGSPYNCVCQTAPSGFSNDPNAVAMGNFSIGGGADTGEPFALMVSPIDGGIFVIDLVGSAAVRFGIKGEVLQPFATKYLPFNVYTVVFDICKPDGSNTWHTESDKSYSEVATAAKDTNTFVRAVIRHHINDINDAHDVLSIHYAEMTFIWGDIYFYSMGDKVNQIKITMKSNGSIVIE